MNTNANTQEQRKPSDARRFTPAQVRLILAGLQKQRWQFDLDATECGSKGDREVAAKLSKEVQHLQDVFAAEEPPKQRTPFEFWLFLAALVLAPTVLWYFKHRA